MLAGCHVESGPAPTPLWRGSAAERRDPVQDQEPDARTAGARKRAEVGAQSEDIGNERLDRVGLVITAAADSTPEQSPHNLRMRFIEPCLPTVSRTVPTGSEWVFEIKHDGFRFLAIRQGKRVRVFSRGGRDWSGQLPAITEALLALPVRSVMLDGEGVICGSDGKSNFDRMRACFSRRGAPQAFLYAFDALQLDGRDLRKEPWASRRATLVQLLAAAKRGVRLCEHIEDVDGAVVFRQACVMGLEGIVAKRRGSRYRSGRCGTGLRSRTWPIPPLSGPCSLR